MPRTLTVQVVSSIPGRVRLKVAPAYRTQEEMQRVAAALTGLPGMGDVRVTVGTGSILAFFDPERESLDSLRAALGGIGVDLGAPAGGTPSAGGAGRTARAATNVTTTLGGLDERVGRMANGAFDLRLLVPVGLGALAIRQILREGLELEEIPWYVLAWDAFQSFNTLYGDGQGSRRPDGERAIEPTAEASAQA